MPRVATRDEMPASLTALGLTSAEETLYRALLRTPSLTVEEAALHLDEQAQPLPEVIDRLVQLGLVRYDDAELVAARPEQALERLIGDEQRRVQERQEQLMALQRLVPALESEHRAARGPLGDPVQIEAIPFGEALPVMQQLARESPGDLLWMRSDQWRLAVSHSVDAWMERQLREGRRSRALYPARVLEEAPETVRKRADLGEHVRVLGTLPGRLAVLGESVALVPRRFDPSDNVLLIVRQPALVQALTMLFEALWERALVVPGIGEDVEGQSAQRLILDQLARGAKDEQIARTLGLSLRTVRRRVADLMDDLEATSRFQAGVEAVRRGWL